MKGKVVSISSKQACDFLLPRHYSGRKPQITKAFGWFDRGDLKAVCTFGKPASYALCKGICGEKNSKYVFELNRLCRVDGWHPQLSQFVAFCLRSLDDSIIVSYSDTDMSHNGYIYQACNFIYTGKTKQRTDMYTEGNKHQRHYKNSQQGKYRKVRSAKHRYVYFATKNKKLKKQWMSDLKYPVCNYPKGENKKYVLGEYLEPKLVSI